MSVAKIATAITTAVPTYSTATLTPRDNNGTVRNFTTYQATVTGTGAVSATVVVQFSNDALTWMTGGTITLSGTTTASDGFACSANWEWVRAGVTAISGTSASVDVTVGW